MSPRMPCELLSEANMLPNASRKPKGRAFQILADVNLTLACEGQCRSFAFTSQRRLWQSGAVTNANQRDPGSQGRMLEHGSARTLALAIVCLCLGIGLGIALFHRTPKPIQTAEPLTTLSPASTQVLARLNGPVEMRFYSLLEPNAAPELREFRGRVIELLDAYLRAAGDKLVFNPQTNASPNDALEDGLKRIDLGKDEGAYIGLVLVAGGTRQVLSQLSPEWEQALEPDISRALANLTQAPNPQGAAAHTQTADSVSVEAVQR